MRQLVFWIALAGCTHAHAPAPAVAVEPWEVPEGWKHETIPFPLEFAPAIAHRGVEELRFPPGFLTAGEPNHWSYAFAWRTRDKADLDARALGDELAAYFRGLLIAVDGDKHRVTEHDIFAYAEGGGGAYVLRAKVPDAFGDAREIALTGKAIRMECPDGALWMFELATATVPNTTLRTLDALVGAATCASIPLPAK